MSQLVGADRDGIKKFFDLREARGAGRDRTDTVARQSVSLGKRIELDQRVIPRLVLEQVMRRTCPAVKVAVGLIHNQGNAVCTAQVTKCGECFRGIFDTCGVVGCDQCNRARTVGDKSRGLCGLWDEARTCRQWNGGDTCHI